MFRTLNDLNKDKKDDKDKKNTNSYAGGENSGIAVENPEDRKNVQDILNQARDTARTPETGEPPKTNCTITLYSNGFQINDEPFRDYSQPENRQMLQELKQGRVPKELRNKYPQGLYVGLNDKTQEKWTPPPPPKYVEFSGQGVNLGGNIHQTQPVKIQAPKDKAAFKIDPNQPTTTIVVRLHDGQTLNLTVNLSTSVASIHQHIREIVNPGPRQIQLISGFPPRPITNLNQTVEEADLADSEIRQTLA